MHVCDNGAVSPMHVCDNGAVYPMKYGHSWGQHGAQLGPTGPRWAPCWPRELCYLGCFVYGYFIILC